MLFTVNGNGGPTGADHGGFYPSTAFGRLTSTSNGLLKSTINIADMGKSPQDGFSEYQGYPGTTRPRWGDYSWGYFLPGSGGQSIRQRVHPVPELHRVGVHLDDWDLRRDQGRSRELGNLSQLRRALALRIRAAG